MSEEVRGWLGGSLAGTLSLVEGLAKHWGPSPWHAPTAACIASALTLGIAPCIDLESELRLAKIALADREKGREWSLEAASRTLDPGDDEPIGQRDEGDGSVTLWCVGSDLINMDGSPTEGDIVWVLPARR